MQTINTQVDRLDDYLNTAQYLPPAPRVMAQLLDTLQEPDVDSSAIVEMIKYDSTLTARLLRACNSAYFGSAAPSDSLQSAVTRLGMREIYTVVVGLLGEQMLTPPGKATGLDADEFWDHSVITAVAARLIAHDRGDDENLAFTAGLLHDVGKTILCAAEAGMYSKLVTEAEEQQLSLLNAERKYFGFDHAEIGGRLMERWKFMPELGSAVWHHHNPTEAATGGSLAAYVYLANLIAYFIGHGHGEISFHTGRRKAALEIIHLEEEELPSYVTRTQEQFKAIRTLFLRR